MPRKRPLSAFQQAFAREVAVLNLATLDEAIAAFQCRDDAQIEAWKPAVHAE